jgi:hypothetical protein
MRSVLQSQIKEHPAHARLRMKRILVTSDHAVRQKEPKHQESIVWPCLVLDSAEVDCGRGGAVIVYKEQGRAEPLLPFDGIGGDRTFAMEDCLPR